MNTKSGKNTVGLKGVNGMTVPEDVYGSVYYYRPFCVLF
jgi:hypothetical protein